MLGKKLSYSNIVATIALFVALGGVSYAAMQVPKESVGTKQLRAEAVTRSKLRIGAVSGVQIDEASLGVVPNAAQSFQAADASHALSAWKSSLAETAALAENSMKLGGLPGRAYGSVLSAHTKIPATDESTEWWLPVSGLGEPGKSRKEVSMFVSLEPAIFSNFADLSQGAPGEGAGAKIRLVPWYDGIPIQGSIPVSDGGSFWAPSMKYELAAGARMALQLVEEPHGEEIPAFELETAMLISPDGPPGEKINTP